MIGVRLCDVLNHLTLVQAGRWSASSYRIKQTPKGKLLYIDVDDHLRQF